MTGKIREILSSQIDPGLVDNLIRLYRELKQKFFLSQYEPCELKCAKFAEVVMRILEYIVKKNYTPFGKNVSLDNLTRQLEQSPKDKFSDSIRTHIPRILRATYDIRSRRGVAHVGEVNPNLMDATFVVSACDWIMAEFIRLYYTADSNEAQRVINSIVERKVPIVEEFGEDLKVLNPDLTVADKILLIFYKKHPNYVLTSDLKNWITTKSPTFITNVLRGLDGDARIHRKGKENIITRKGIEYVEKNLSREF